MGDDFDLVSTTTDAVSADTSSAVLAPEALPLKVEEVVSAGTEEQNLPRPADHAVGPEGKLAPVKLTKREFDRRLETLRPELTSWLRRIEQEQLKLVVLFDGRDVGRKRGIVTRIAEAADLRVCRVAPFAAPDERERTQWFFQPYVNQLPAAGEVVLFDGSWYSRAAAERLMGFRSDDECAELLRSCAEFEQILGRAGVTVIKYWLSVPDEDPGEQFRTAVRTLTHAYGLSTKSFDSRARWEDVHRLRDDILTSSGGPAPWYAIEGDDRRSVRLTCLRHLLGLVPRPSAHPQDPNAATVGEILSLAEDYDPAYD